MEMKIVQTELEEEIMVAGNKLLSPPFSARSLLLLLENLENCLRRVEQSPSESVHWAMNPALKALMAQELLSHPDLDVKVTLASCFSEILRIKVPVFPYEDEKMKDILQLIVAAFDHMHDASSPSYYRRVSILEIVAKVRPWILMVDLQLHSMIVEMFKHFLTNIRESHPDVVFSSMGTIMILILDEIEEIPPEIISLLLSTTRKGNQDVLPVAQKLGERVIENCRLKLKPYIPRAKQYCGKKRGRSDLQDSATATEKTNGESGTKDQVFQEEDNRAGSKKAETKVFKEKKHKREDGVYLWEIMKGIRSRGAQKDQAIFLEEDNRKETWDAKWKVFKEKKHQKEDEVLLREFAIEKRSRGAQKELAIFQGDNRKESRKTNVKVFIEKTHEKEDVVSIGENLGEEISKHVVQQCPESKRKLKYKGKQAMDTKCNQRKMHQFLSNLKGTKRRIIENSIFSAFLDIPGCPINRQLIAALIECFDVKTDAFIVAGQPLKFCGKEIEECIGLSVEGKRVDLNFETRNIAPPIAHRYFEIVEGNARIKKESKGVNTETEDGETRSCLNVPISLLLQKLNLMSVDGKSEADDFLRLSILYMFNAYFFPTLGRYISWWPLKFLENLEDFNSYAWGRAVYDYLHTSLVKAARHLAGKNEIYTYMNGCIPLLETLACKRISKLQVVGHQANLHPSVLNCNENRNVLSFYSFRMMLGKLQPDEIKKCKHCENGLKICQNGRSHGGEARQA